MSLKLVFIDPNASYDGLDFSRGSVSGTESCTMLLAEALIRRGHEVTVCNTRESVLEVNGVRYCPLADAGPFGSDGIAISNNSVSVLDRFPLSATHCLGTSRPAASTTSEKA